MPRLSNFLRNLTFHFRLFLYMVTSCGMWDVVQIMNGGYRAWRALKSVLSNRGLGIKAKKCLYKGVIVPTALYGQRHVV